MTEARWKWIGISLQLAGVTISMTCLIAALIKINEMLAVLGN